MVGDNRLLPPDSPEMLGDNANDYVIGAARGRIQDDANRLVRIRLGGRRSRQRKPSARCHKRSGRERLQATEDHVVSPRVFPLF
jgi:hypothetical protein